MDKLSAVMISAICFLVCFSAAVVYGTWFADEDEVAYVANIQQIEEEMALSNIAMNDDAQVINGGGQDMWVRARVEEPEYGEASAKAEARPYELVSDTIVEEPTPAELKNGVWTLESDGYYYFSIPVSPGEQSKSLFRSVVSRGAQGKLDSSSVKVQAEAVQVNWVSKEAESGKEAFQLFGLLQPLQEYKGTFV